MPSVLLTPSLPLLPGSYEVGHHASMTSPRCATTQAHSGQIKWLCTTTEIQSKSFLLLDNLLRSLPQSWKASIAPVQGSPVSMNRSKKKQLGLNLHADSKSQASMDQTNAMLGTVLSRCLGIYIRKYLDASTGLPPKGWMYLGFRHWYWRNSLGHTNTAAQQMLKEWIVISVLKQKQKNRNKPKH